MPCPPPSFAGAGLAWSVHALKKRANAKYFGLCFFASYWLSSDVPPERKKHSQNRFLFKAVFFKKSMFKG